MCVITKVFTDKYGGTNGRSNRQTDGHTDERYDYNRASSIFRRALKIVQVGKLHISTVPDTFYFPIFAFFQHSFTIFSACVQHALSVRSSFLVLHSSFALVQRSQSVQRSLNRAYTYRSHRSCLYTSHLMTEL